eukprot:COSAG01_NODE_39747_length_472_cov_2.335121_1_plen_73_part_00
MCSDCGLKQPSCTIPDQPEAGAWCVGCAASHPGAVPRTKKKRKMCSDCGLKRPSHAIPDCKVWSYITHLLVV